MDKEVKPREWTINTYINEIVTSGLKESNNITVIEKSYADVLEEKLRIATEALKEISKTTYGTELCASEEENNTILARYYFDGYYCAIRALNAIRVIK